MFSQKQIPFKNILKVLQTTYDKYKCFFKQTLMKLKHLL